MRRFEKIPILYCNFGAFRNGASMALPGIGIFVSKKYAQDDALLRHEYGHILQAKKWGYFFFYFRVAFSSLYSAYKNPRYHKYHWTEWSANFLSYMYFKKKETIEWNEDSFPIQPDFTKKEVLSPLPSFCRDCSLFFQKYLGKSED